MELALNNFEVLDQTQMEEIDGGYTAAQNLALATIGLVCCTCTPVSIAVGFISVVGAASDWAKTQSRYLR